MSSSKKSSGAVDDYIAQAQAYAQPICEKLRALIRKVAPELVEASKWRVPMMLSEGRRRNEQYR